MNKKIQQLFFILSNSSRSDLEDKTHPLFDEEMMSIPTFENAM